MRSGKEEEEEGGLEFDALLSLLLMVAVANEGTTDAS
jgi:hypothetical protein